MKRGRLPSRPLLKSSKTATSKDRAISERHRSEVVALAINNAFDTLGPDMKEVLLFHLARVHQYVPSQQDSLVALSRSLEKIFSAGGARILIERIYLEMDRLAGAAAETQYSATSQHFSKEKPSI